MTASVTEEQWDAVRKSVRTTAGRFCELVSSIPDPGTKATVKWSVADTTAHVTTVAFLNTMLLQAATVPFNMPGLTEAIAATTVEGVHGLNDQVLSYFTERDAGRLTGVLRDHIDLMLTAARSHDPAETFSWLGGARLPLAGMFAHMVNELLIHGNDIARAVKVPWGHATRGCRAFLRPVLRRAGRREYRPAAGRQQTAAEAAHRGGVPLRLHHPGHVRGTQRPGRHRAGRPTR